MWNRALLVGLLVFALVGAVGPLAVYGLAAGGVLAMPRDLQSWGLFGDFVGGTSGTIISLLNLLVILYIAINVQAIQARQQHDRDLAARRRGLAFDMHREWNSLAMYEARTAAGKMVRNSPERTLDQVDAAEPAETAAKLWLVIAFYQRLALTLQHGEIDTKVVPALFGDTFVWWHRHCFRNQLRPTGWESWTLMDYLDQWLRTNAPTADHALWTSRAEAYGKAGEGSGGVTTGSAG